MIKGIENSGYPLQGVVASKLLNRGFHVTEEWGFPDRSSNEPRTLDLAAFCDGEDAGDIVSGLLLLIECKRSNLPYVFFRTLGHQEVSWFPHIAGLPHGGIALLHVVNGMQAVAHTVPGAQSMGLDELPFVAPGTDRAAVFSRAEVSGDKVTLSGSEPFNSVIMPLASASDYARGAYAHSPNPDGRTGTDRFHLRLIICVAVLDAPMVLIESPEQFADPILTPWVRVIRQEPNLAQFSEGRIRQYAVDAVHVDFFDTFIETHLLPFAVEFGKRAVRLGTGPLKNGGMVPDIDHWKWEEITEFRR